MEDTHWEKLYTYTMRIKQVLILVLMEDTHWGTDEPINGDDITVLILVLMEDTHWEVSSFNKHLKIRS